MRRLPPLVAVRAFEAGARHLSFTRAADELCVTQTAISHQVRQLETWLGVRLFERAGHALRLTGAGRTYLAEVGEVLDRLATVTEAVRGRRDGPLRITVLPSFAACWLVPRLGRFRALHPDIELKLTSSPETSAFTEDRFDLGIRSGLGRWPGLKADLIAQEMLSPVCSPAIAAGLPSPCSPSDLLASHLLHDTPKDAWSRWFRHAGQPEAALAAGHAFDDHGHLLQAAAEGQGMALGKLFLAEHALREGRLVRPVDLILPNDYSYWLVYPRTVAGRPDVGRFRTWLLAEAKATAAALMAQGAVP
ncbi:transcriptional regulator [Labrys sp. WJW]|uniref:transcriptional regulator GcvA n=1 Tax=Labrys sp. WJW TaxID=1737983 RepID=UPI00083620E1|nr:transcriptional regulator GcvA [Labrys sp. WJW]OCC04405.1 transcriptional regulator [Labrys sp. WJW]